MLTARGPVQIVGVVVTLTPLVTSGPGEAFDGLVAYFRYSTESNGTITMGSLMDDILMLFQVISIGA